MVCHFETHVTQGNQAAIINRLLPDCQVVGNYAYARLDRIWILYDDTVIISVHSASEQAIH